MRPGRLRIERTGPPQRVSGGASRQGPDMMTRMSQSNSGPGRTRKSASLRLAPAAQAGMPSLARRRHGRTALAIGFAAEPRHLGPQCSTQSRPRRDEPKPGEHGDRSKSAAIESAVVKHAVSAKPHNPRRPIAPAGPSQL
jgi:hypothetical protein